MEPTTLPSRKARVELRLIINGHEAYSLEGFFNQSLNQGIDRSVVPEWDLEQNKGSEVIVLGAREKHLTVQEAQNTLTSNALRNYSGSGSSIDVRVRYNNIS